MRGTNASMRLSSFSLVVVIGLLVLGLLGAPSWRASADAIVSTLQQGANLPTFVDLPQGATATYPGSGIYKAPISQAMSDAIERQTQENWDTFKIAKESNLGLPLGSFYLRAGNGRYVELAIYERAAFTVFRGQPARQILSSVLSSGRVQIEITEFVQLFESVKLAFRKLPVAGEGGLDTPAVETMDKLLTADKAKAVDGSWSTADKFLNVDGTLASIDPKLGVQPLALAQPNATTGHRVPEVIAAGLRTMFGEKVLENVGLPLGAAVWIQAKINGVLKPVVVQVFERMIITYNPQNDEANRVQVGLGGQIVHSGLDKAAAPPTLTPVVTPTPEATATRASNQESVRYPNPIPAEIKIFAQGARLEFKEGNGNAVAVSNLDRALIKQGATGAETHLLLPYEVGRNPDQYSRIEARQSVRKWKREKGWKYIDAALTQEMRSLGATELHGGSDRGYSYTYVDDDGALVFGRYSIESLSASNNQAGGLSWNLGALIELLADIHEPHIAGEWGFREAGRRFTNGIDLTVSRNDFYVHDGRNYVYSILIFR
jgi:hypothetical protein